MISVSRVFVVETIFVSEVHIVYIRPWCVRTLVRRDRTDKVMGIGLFVLCHSGICGGVSDGWENGAKYFGTPT